MAPAEVCKGEFDALQVGVGNSLRRGGGELARAAPAVTQAVASADCEGYGDNYPPACYVAT